MLSDLSRTTAHVLLLSLLLIACWCIAAPKTSVASASEAADYADSKLYQDVTARVAQGVAYHRAAVELQRAHHYPTRPFITVRPPTLAVTAAALGWSVMQICAGGLLAGCAIAWYAFARVTSGPAESALSALAVIGGGLSVFVPQMVVLHEVWAGLFLTLALAAQLGLPHHWLLTLLLAGCALAIRELALPFVALAAAFALVEGQWRVLASWGLLVLLFLAGMVWHYEQTMLFILPTDHPSPGWPFDLRPGAAVTAVIHSSPLQMLPTPLARLLAVLPLLGWAVLPGRGGLFALLLFAGYALLLALFARPDNFYWAATVLPAYFVGLALVPRAAMQIAGAMARS